MRTELRFDERELEILAEARRLLPLLRKRKDLALTARSSRHLPMRVAAFAIDEGHWRRYTLSDAVTCLALALREGERNADESGRYDVHHVRPVLSDPPSSGDDVARQVRRANAWHDAVVRRAMLLAHQLARAGRGDGPNVALRKVIAPNTSVPAPPLPPAG